MAGKQELGPVRATSVRELANRITLRKVRNEGHEYVELREDGKRHIFFCILCLSPCYSEDALFDHLRGTLHQKRYSAAKATLLLQNRWPFNDGVLFFHNSPEQQDKQLVISSQNKDLVLHSHKNSNLNHSKNLNSEENSNGNGTYSSPDSEKNYLYIPEVVIRNEISVLGVSFSGFGDISVRICEGEGFSNWIQRIWCAWLGEVGKEDLGDMAREHDFAVITFPYTYDLGISGIYDSFSKSPPAIVHQDTQVVVESPRKRRKKPVRSGAHTDVETVQGPRKKRKKSFSDPEDISKSLVSESGSSRELSVVSSSSTSNKVLRQQIRQQERAAAERMCDICRQKMLPGKDIATLLNMNTGRLACSSRNVNGAFHVFHTSCLIHWILVCEFETRKNQSSNQEMTCKTVRESRSKSNVTGTEDEKEPPKVQITSVFCPECQGTGINQRELPTIPISQMFTLKLEASDKHRAWMRSPEKLQNCSTGLCFPSRSEEMIKEKVLPLKFLRFYKANV